MGLQSTRWMQLEADAWHQRNKAKTTAAISSDDPVIRTLVEAGLKPRTVFEVGCGHGYRLAAMRDSWGAKVWGCDLSKDAIRYGLQKYGDNDFQIGWREAKNLRGVPSQAFDMVIYGFCLYACDPDDLFIIAREGDRILKDGGHLVIYDFLPDHPHSRSYKYDHMLKTYKADYSKLFLGHPYYSIYKQVVMPHEAGEEINGDTRIAVKILKKDVQNAFPLGDA